MCISFSNCSPTYAKKQEHVIGMERFDKCTGFNNNLNAIVTRFGKRATSFHGEIFLLPLPGSVSAAR